MAAASYVISCALEDAGLIAIGQTPPATLQARALSRLNDLIAFHMTQGLKLWTWETLTLPFEIGKSTYSFGPAGDAVGRRPTHVNSAVALDSSGVNKRPLGPTSREELLRLPNTPGAPVFFYVQPVVTELLVTVWPPPSATDESLQITIRRPVATLPDVNADIDFPPEWTLFLRWALAEDFCAGQPAQIATHCAQRMAYYKGELEDVDAEGGYVELRMTGDQS